MSEAAAIKALRDQRKESIRRVSGLVAEQGRELKAIKNFLAGDGASAPDIAGSTGLPVSRVMYFLATLKQYGEVVEGSKDGGYFRYRLVEKEGERS